ncbi:MAG: hypothetical protein FWF82_02235, partial [Oscillospiraceae bacterium]|nr:hypothetical protein [Oscillospiraceae bacterium]
MKKKLTSLFSLFILFGFFSVSVDSTESAESESIKYVIISPYNDIDWETVGRYKAGLHNHSTFSDGINTRKAMITDAYRKGYDIFTLTDHDWITSSWDDEGFGGYKNDSHHKLIPTPEEQAEIESGTYSGQYATGYLQGDEDTEHWVNIEQLKDMGVPIYRTQGNGMIGLSDSNEHTMRIFYDHVNTYFAEYVNISASGTVVEKLNRILSDTEKLGGISVINHPNRSIRGREINDLEVEPDLVIDEEHILKYADLFRRYESCVGMEIMNRLDFDTRTSRIIWDEVLKETLPQRAVWGFSSDDAHGTSEVGYSYNIMFMNELSQPAVRTAMETGAFLAAARVARLEGVNKYVRIGTSDYITPPIGCETVVFLLDEPMPRIDKIIVADNKITVKGGDYDTIEWIADGNLIANGETLDLNEKSKHFDRFNHYVRAQIKSDTGIIYTQPFVITLCCGDGLCGDCDVCGKCVCD